MPWLAAKQATCPPRAVRARAARPLAHARAAPFYKVARAPPSMRREGVAPLLARISQRRRRALKRRLFMLSWALIFLVVALIAGLLGFTGIAGAATGIAKVLFFVFLVVFLISLIAGQGGRAPL
jgi:uncharacterized membrane protein YtjA (UPF0391 family)